MPTDYFLLENYRPIFKTPACPQIKILRALL